MCNLVHVASKQLDIDNTELPCYNIARELLLGGIMKIYDIVKCSFVDYPGKIAAVIFTRGCEPFRCRYCHNAHIIPLEGPCNTTEEKVFDFLNNRKGLLGGVVVTGGEPTAQADLVPFLRKLRALNAFSIKLDTNGYRPDVLKQVLTEKLVDYVAMDIKAPKEKYELITQVPFNERKIQACIDLIKEANIPHQFRTTYDKRYLNDRDIEKIKKWLMDDENYVVNQCILRDAQGNEIQ